VTRLERREFSLPLASPLSTASGAIDHREGIALRLGEGPRGIGEATPLPGWTESLEACRATLSGVGDPRETLADLGDRPAARHGLALALADRRARRAGVPLYRHLGGDRGIERVPANATVGDGSPGSTVAAAREAVEAGFRTIKCKVGARPVDRDLERVRAVHDAIGTGATLRLDANGSWDRREAERALSALADLGIEYVEQPVPADDVAGHQALSGGAVPIALDETLAGRDAAGIEALADAADLLVLKPMVLGGPDRAVEIGRRARERGLGITVTTTIDAVIARTGAIHVAAALGIDRACGLATAELLERDLGPDPAPVRDGRVAVPRTPGLGTDGPWGERDA
jgi:o-succinylbenzoate synthase